MSPRTVRNRPKHNPNQLRCRFASCLRWFRNQSGLTKHVRICHPGRATSPRRQHSPQAPSQSPTVFPIHRSNSTSLSTPPAGSIQLQDQSSPRAPSPTIFSRHRSNSTSPSTPLAGSIQLQHQSSPPAYNLHGTPRESSPSPEGDEPILKVFHPIINGMSWTSWSPSFLLTNSFSRAPL